MREVPLLQRLPYREKIIEKKYYTIGEVAKHFKVATSLIRFWETEFDFIKPQKNKKGNRQYTKDEIDNITLIFHLVKEKGYTLAGAKEIIKADRDKAKTKSEAVKTLKEIRGFLVELKGKIS